MKNGRKMNRKVNESEISHSTLDFNEERRLEGVEKGKSKV
jgi:hypothetical protein